jgi:adenine-specific DNA-methyltransferase
VADRTQPRITPVRAFGHPGDTRPNIPAAELESFARPEERQPTIVRYPRDPSLDPQLVWKGKDEQDSRDLEVPAVPIYIQETIDPLALVVELRAASQGLRTEEQLGFFAPYPDLTFEHKVDFYRHPGKWSNRMILGDSLLVLTSPRRPRPGACRPGLARASGSIPTPSVGCWSDEASETSQQLLPL